MVWFSSPTYTAPTWIQVQTVSATAATTTYYPWLTNVTPTASTVWADNSNTAYTWVRLSQTQALTLYRKHQDQISAPHVHRVTEQELAEREQELYRRAVAQHDQQEIDRLARQMAQRAQEMAERQRATEEIRHRVREADERRAAAQGRANEFLLEHLSPEQRRTFKKNKWFIVEGGISKTQYRIRCDNVMANIDVLDADRARTHRLCGHANHDIPLGDQLLAQKMMLQFSEDEFLRLANRHQA